LTAAVGVGRVGPLHVPVVVVACFLFELRLLRVELLLLLVAFVIQFGVGARGLGLSGSQDGRREGLAEVRERLALAHRRWLMLSGRRKLRGHGERWMTVEEAEDH
jgi:hypothetical protein